MARWYDQTLPAINNSDLPDRLKLTLLTLHSFRGNNDECWPSIKAIAQRRGSSQRTVMRHTRHLAQRGYVHVTKQKGRPNHYRFVGSRGQELSLQPEAQPVTILRVTTPDVAPTSDSTTCHPRVGQDYVSQGNQLKGQLKEQEQDPATPETAVVVSESTERQTANGLNGDSLEIELQRRGVFPKIAAALATDRPQRVKAVLSNAFYDDKSGAYPKTVIEADTPLHECKELGGRERAQYDVEAVLRAAGYMTADELARLPALREAVNEMDGDPSGQEQRVGGRSTVPGDDFGPGDEGENIFGDE